MPEAPTPDDRMRDGVRYFTQQLRQAGLIGEMPSAVGQDREAAPDPVAVIQDGLPPMVRTVRQPDRR